MMTLQNEFVTEPFNVCVQHTLNSLHSAEFRQKGRIPVHYRKPSLETCFDGT